MATRNDLDCVTIKLRDKGRTRDANRRLMTRIAAINTPHVSVDVAEAYWTKSTEVVFSLNRPAVSMVVHAPAQGVESAYVGVTTEEPVKLGRVIFIAPGRDLRYRMSVGKLRTVTCAFDRTYSERVVGSLADLSESQLLSCLDVRSSLVPSILLRLMNEALHPGVLSTPVVESFGQAMLVECAHLLLSHDARQRTEGRLSARHFKLIDEYLANVSGETPSVKALAAACGFSESHFAKLFREQMNQSIGQYIRSVQIAKATTYLLETQLPLKEIAYRLGFSTPANFSVAFRAATGQTPGRFREGRPH